MVNSRSPKDLIHVTSCYKSFDFLFTIPVYVPDDVYEVDHEDSDEDEDDDDDVLGQKGHSIDLVDDDDDDDGMLQS